MMFEKLRKLYPYEVEFIENVGTGLYSACSASRVTCLNGYIDSIMDKVEFPQNVRAALRDYAKLVLQQAELDEQNGIVYHNTFEADTDDISEGR